MPIHGEQIRCIGGEIYAYVHESALTNLPPRLFWNVLLDVAPIRWNGQDWSCGILCDWLSWDIRRWPDLDGVSLDETMDPAAVESSFYLAEHHPFVLRSLALRRVAGTARFAVSVAGNFDLCGFGDLDATNVAVDVDAEAHFSSLIIVPGNLAANPRAPEDACSTAAKFIDLTDFSAPQWDSVRFVFAPLHSAD